MLNHGVTRVFCGTKRFSLTKISANLLYCVKLNTRTIRPVHVQTVVKPSCSKIVHGCQRHFSTTVNSSTSTDDNPVIEREVLSKFQITNLNNSG